MEVAVQHISCNTGNSTLWECKENKLPNIVMYARVIFRILNRILMAKSQKPVADMVYLRYIYLEKTEK